MSSDEETHRSRSWDRRQEPVADPFLAFQQRVMQQFANMQKQFDDFRKLHMSSTSKVAGVSKIIRKPAAENRPVPYKNPYKLDRRSGVQNESVILPVSTPEPILPNPVVVEVEMHNVNTVEGVESTEPVAPNVALNITESTQSNRPILEDASDNEVNVSNLNSSTVLDNNIEVDNTVNNGQSVKGAGTLPKPSSNIEAEVSTPPLPSSPSRSRPRERSVNFEARQDDNDSQFEIRRNVISSNLPRSRSLDSEGVSQINSEHWGARLVSLLESRAEAVSESKFILTKDTKFEVWYGMLQTDAIAKNIDISKKEPFTPYEEKKLRHMVLQRLDKNYLSEVINLATFDEILYAVKEIRRAEGNVSRGTVKDKFNRLEIQRGERMSRFFKRISEAVESYKTVTGKDIPEEEIFDRLQRGAAVIYSGINMVVKCKGTYPKMSIQDLKINLLQEEAEALKDSGPSQAKFVRNNNPEDNRSNERPRTRTRIYRRNQSPIRKVQCFNCGKLGHLGRHCPDFSRGTECFQCHRFGHIARECYYRLRTQRQLEVQLKVTKFEENMSKPGPSHQVIPVEDDSTTAPEPEEEVTKTVSQQTLNGVTILVIHDQSQSAMDIDDPQPTETAEIGKRIHFIGDSGASAHIVNDSKLLTWAKPFRHVVEGANSDPSTFLEVLFKGTLSGLNGKDLEVVLDNVLVVPGCSENLISFRRFTDVGYHVILTKEFAKIFDPSNNSVILQGEYSKPYWVFTIQGRESCKVFVSKNDDHSYQSTKRPRLAPPPRSTCVSMNTSKSQNVVSEPVASTSSCSSNSIQRQTPLEVQTKYRSRTN